MISRLTTGPRLTLAERRALQPLRVTYHATQHLFTAEELARLRFLRWLVRSAHWSGALDQPDERSERLGSAVMSLTWMPGFPP